MSPRSKSSASGEPSASGGDSSGVTAGTASASGARAARSKTRSRAPSKSGCSATCATCDGRCCAVFLLSRPYAELLSDVDTILDGAYMVDMLVPLSPDEAAERGRRFGVLFSDSPDIERFTCRHWDEETRLCGAYGSRPDMCRRFPYGTECEHCGFVGGEGPDSSS